MARKRSHEMTRERWLDLARSQDVRDRIRNDSGLDDFHAVIRAIARRPAFDWDEAVATLHMVYGWMPTMLREIAVAGPAARQHLVSLLNRVKNGSTLTTDELKDVQHFANRSIVGASKLLHVISPDHYPIWDSRVAEVFLWQGVSTEVFSTLPRYVEYLDELHRWASDAEVIAECAALRGLNPAQSAAGDLRLVELVLFCKGQLMAARP